jgi:hypothetical protein
MRKQISKSNNETKKKEKGKSRAREMSGDKWYAKWETELWRIVKESGWGQKWEGEEGEKQEK